VLIIDVLMGRKMKAAGKAVTQSFLETVLATVVIEHEDCDRKCFLTLS